MIRCCIFDMDGLLLDTERQMYLKIGLEVSAELGQPIDAEYLTKMMGGSWSAYEINVAEHMGKDFPIKQYMKILNERIKYSILHDVQPLRPGAREVLDYCKKQKILMAIATSTPKKNAYRCLENANLLDYFDFIITGDQVVHGKPDPEIFLTVVDHFGVDKKEAVVLEDGHNGSLAAKRGGLHLILVEDLAYVSEEDREYADLHTYQLIDAIGYLEKENERTAGV